MSDAPPPPFSPPPQPQGNPYSAQQPGWYAAGPAAPVDVLGRPLAEWWKRFVAYLIDAVVIAVPAIVLVIVVVIGGARRLEVNDQTGEIESGGGAFFGSIILAGLLISLVQLAYAIVMNGSDRGQTVGKIAMKIQVRDALHGGPIGYGKAVVRHVPIVLIGAVCGLVNILDGLWPLWDGQRQALHDKLAGTVVVDIGVPAP